MSRTFTHAPRSVAFKNVVGHSDSKSEFSTMTMQELVKRIEDETFYVEIDYLRTSSWYPWVNGIFLSQGGLHLNEDVSTIHRVTSPSFYCTKYVVKEGAALDKELYSSLMQCADQLGEVFRPVVDDKRVLAPEKMSRSWEYVHGGLRKCTPVSMFDYLGVKDDDTWYEVIVAMPSDDGILNVRTTTEFIGELTGKQRHDLKKFKALYTIDDEEDTSVSRSKMKMEMRDITKLANSQDCADYEDLDVYDYS